MKKLKIPQPKAIIGQEVSIENRRRGGQFEEGILETADYQLQYNSWHYCVRLYRISKNNNPLRAYVSDEEIFPINTKSK